ncbi:hypothetical protein Ct61P_14540 [Colletotrichum tofieldiae]|nr:hypothetical protein Ct61P_14540 [Colletotrichum tofieldiae]
MKREASHIRTAGTAGNDLTIQVCDRSTLFDIEADIMAHGNNHTTLLFEQPQRDVRTATALRRSIHDNPAAMSG